MNVYTSLAAGQVVLGLLMPLSSFSPYEYDIEPFANDTRNPFDFNKRVALDNPTASKKQVTYFEEILGASDPTYAVAEDTVVAVKQLLATVSPKLPMAELDILDNGVVQLLWPVSGGFHVVEVGSTEFALMSSLSGHKADSYRGPLWQLTFTVSQWTSENLSPTYSNFGSYTLYGTEALSSMNAASTSVSRISETNREFSVTR